MQTRVRKDTGLIQYNSTQLFSFIEKMVKIEANQSLIILTDSDLYPKEGWSFGKQVSFMNVE